MKDDRSNCKPNYARSRWFGVLMQYASVSFAPCASILNRSHVSHQLHRSHYMRTVSNSHVSAILHPVRQKSFHIQNAHSGTYRYLSVYTMYIVIRRLPDIQLCGNLWYLNYERGLSMNHDLIDFVYEVINYFSITQRKRKFNGAHRSIFYTRMIQESGWVRWY